jgi:hypothetical protein
VAIGKRMGVEQLFEGRHFDREVIILCVRWYLRFKLSLRDLVEMMAERGPSVSARPSASGLPQGSASVRPLPATQRVSSSPARLERDDQKSSRPKD